MDSFCEKPLPPPRPQEKKTCSTNVCSMLSRSHLCFLPEFVAILPNIAGKAAPSSSKSAGAGRCPGSSGASVTLRTWERRYFQRRMFHPLRSGRLGRLANKCKQYSLAAEFGTGIIPPLVSAGTLVATCWVDGGGCPTFTRLFRLFDKCTVHMIKNERFLVAKWPLSQVSVMCNGCQFCFAVST